MYEADFVNSSEKYRPVPWWVWNGGMDEDKMERQLKELLDKGIHEFFIFSSWGLEIPFNEGIWWDKVDFTLRRCKELSMKVWIYDEYTWPSGVSAGRVLRNYPGTRNVVMAYSQTRANKGKDVSSELHGRLLAVQLVTPDGQAYSVEDYDIEEYENGKTLRWTNTTHSPVTLLIFSRVITAEKGMPYAFGAPWTWRQEGYVNTLDPTAIKKFIELSYQPYADRFSNYLGDTLVGFFTDEPAISYYGQAMGKLQPFPYTPGLFSIFEQRYGYDLKGHLHELIMEVGNFRRTRYDYWSLITELFATAYSRQLRDWCDRHNLLFTGHFCGEENVHQNRFWSGDIHSSAKWMSVPGLDLLETVTSFDEGRSSDTIYGQESGNRSFNSTVKLITSTARYSGAKRVMCESYGVSPWSLAPEDQKKMTDWLTALGVNLINDNLIPYATHSIRPYTICGKAFTTPWWRYYKIFTDYAGRVSQLASEGILQSHIAILYPTASSWCEDPQGDSWKTMQESIYSATDALLRKHWDWEFIFDSVLERGSVKEGRIDVRNASYEVLMLPGLPTLTNQVSEVILRFVENGGNLIVCGQWPQNTPEGNLNFEGEISKVANSENVSFLSDLDGEQFARRMDKFLARKIPRAFVIKGSGARNIISALRRLDDMNVIFLSNLRDDRTRAEIELLLAGEIEIWQTETGEQFSADDKIITRSASGSSILPYDFAPHESILLVIRTDRRSQIPVLAENHPGYQEAIGEIPLSDEWIFHTERENHLRLDISVKADPEGEGVQKEWYKGKGRDWYHAEDGHSPVAIESDLRHYWIKAQVNIEYIPGELKVIVDNGQEVEGVYVNGQEIKEKGNIALWNEENLAFKATQAFRLGLNTVVVKAKPSLFHSYENGGNMVDRSYIPPLVLEGSFAVKRVRNKTVLVKEAGKIQSGSWHTQGYPNYSGIGTYTQSFSIGKTVPGSPQKFWLDLGKVRDTAEIYINGQHVRTVIWSPYRADITRYLHPGLNQLMVKTANNLGNLLPRYYMGWLPGPVPAGLLGPARVIITQAEL